MRNECGAMQDFLEAEVSEIPEVLIARLTQVNTFIARSGKLLADAKYVQDAMQAEVYSSYPEAIQKMPATTARNFVNSQTADINYFVNWLDRINRSLVHIGDNMRTQLSFAKEELRLTKSGY